MVQPLSDRLQILFSNFALLGDTVATLNQADLSFAIGGSGCLFLLGNERSPDDIDIYLPNAQHDQADQLFGIKSFTYRSVQEEVRNSNPSNDHSIQLTSALRLKTIGKEYDLELTPDVLSMRMEAQRSDQKVFLYPPEDVLLIKAILQRGEDVGKHDVADIQKFLKIYPDVRVDYLKRRIQVLGAQDRVNSIFREAGLDL